MIDLTYVAPQQLHDWWNFVLPGLKECLRHESDDAFPEDVYWMLKTQQATLHIGTKAGAYVGFVVLNQAVDIYSGRVRLNIWFLHSKNGMDVLEEGLAVIEQIAAKINAVEITFRANREIFERWARPLGFHLREVELVKEV